MGNAVQSEYGRPKPAPPQKVVLQVGLPPDGADKDEAENLKRELEECANKWIAKNTGKDPPAADTRSLHRWFTDRHSIPGGGQDERQKATAAQDENTTEKTPPGTKKAVVGDEGTHKTIVNDKGTHKRGK